MGADELRTLLNGAGFSPVEVATVELTIVWPDADSRSPGFSARRSGRSSRRCRPAAARSSTPISTADSAPPHPSAARRSR